jgi:hypothetical protein
MVCIRESIHTKERTVAFIPLKIKKESILMGLRNIEYEGECITVMNTCWDILSKNAEVINKI